MKKILIALDYDPLAEKVARSGFKIAKALNAKVILLHVIDYPLFPTLPFGVFGYESPQPAEFDYSIEAIREHSKDFLSAIAKKLGNKDTTISVAEGDAADTIANSAAKKKANIIIMGSHRMKGLNKLLFTDTAASVIKHSNIPVMTIPTSN